MAWLSGWSKRKKITLTGGSSGAQTNYQLKLTISYDSDMQADFDDLRFTKSDGTTLIDCWLESKTDSTTATIWVEFLTTPANTVTEDYYMYYGNSGVSSVWNIDNTFLFGDDFGGTLLDTNKWNLLAGDVTVSGGNLLLSGTSSTRGEINGKTSIPINAAIYSKIYFSQVNSVATHFNTLSKATDASTRLGTYIRYTDGEIASVTRTSGGSEVTDWGSSVTPTNSHIYKNTWKSGEVKYYIDDALKVTHTLNVPAINLISYFKEGTVIGGNAFIDYTFVTKFVDNPATYGFGSEESLSGHPTMMRFGGIPYMKFNNGRNSW